MKAVWIIAKRELAAYFTSPVAYVFLVIFLLMTGFFTFTAGNFFERGEAKMKKDPDKSGEDLAEKQIARSSASQNGR